MKKIMLYGLLILGSCLGDLALAAPSFKRNEELTADEYVYLPPQAQALVVQDFIAAVLQALKNKQAQTCDGGVIGQFGNSGLGYGLYRGAISCFSTEGTTRWSIITSDLNGTKYTLQCAPETSCYYVQEGNLAVFKFFDGRLTPVRLRPTEVEEAAKAANRSYSLYRETETIPNKIVRTLRSLGLL